MAFREQIVFPASAVGDVADAQGIHDSEAVDDALEIAELLAKGAGIRDGDQVGPALDGGAVDGKIAGEAVFGGEGGGGDGNHGSVLLLCWQSEGLSEKIDVLLPPSRHFRKEAFHLVIYACFQLYGSVVHLAKGYSERFYPSAFPR